MNPGKGGKMKHMIVASLALGVASAVPAQAQDSSGPDLGPPVVVGEVSGPVELRVGQLLEMRLPVRGGTGYSWQSTGNVPACLQLVGQHRLPRLPGNEMPGGLEAQLLIYRAIAPGAGRLSIAYQRPWETGMPAARLVRYQVAVTR